MKEGGVQGTKKQVIVLAASMTSSFSLRCLSNKNRIVRCVCVNVYFFGEDGTIQKYYLVFLSLFGSWTAATEQRRGSGKIDKIKKNPHLLQMSEKCITNSTVT
jgi:hypothetical protein